MHPKTEQSRKKIEIQYHLRQRMGSTAVRKALQRGWKAYKRKYDKDHSEKLWDDYETHGITADANAVAHIRAAWMLINSEMDTYLQKEASNDNPPLILPPPRAWFMWPVSDEFSTWHHKTYFLHRNTPRPTISQVKQWLKEFI